MINYDISTAEFKRIMQCGNGKCYLVLSNCKNKEKYRKTVLWGCLHNISFDTQCEGTRAEYLYGLVSLYNDDGYFSTPVIEKFKKLSPNLRGWDYAHFCDLLRIFASHGNEPARPALHEKYNLLYPSVLKRRKIIGYNAARDNYEKLSISIVDLEGLPAFMSIAQDIGNLFLQNKIYDGGDFEWFYICFEKEVGKTTLEKYMRREGRNNPAIKTFYQSVQTARAEYIPRKKPKASPPTAQQVVEASESGNLGLRLKIDFKRRAEEEQRLLLARAVLEEQDLNKKAEMLDAFTISGFPAEVESIIDYTKSDNEKLIEAAFDALAATRHPAVREYALQLLQSGENFSQALRMLLLNYRNCDKALLVSCLNKLKVTYEDESGWHSVVSSILDAYGRKIKLPQEAVLFIYNKSLCSFCREYAVREMSKRGWLTEEIKEECLHDSNFDIRDYIKKRD